jgi:hypothetical protein
MDNKIENPTNAFVMTSYCIYFWFVRCCFGTENS